MSFYLYPCHSIFNSNSDEEVAGRHREDCGRRDGEGCPGREFRAGGFLRRRRSQGLDLLRLGEMGF
jgi:hypothetical protein